MTPSSSPEEQLLRACVFHVPRNPFHDPNALECHPDGGLLVVNGRVAACGDYATLRAAHPNARTIDLRGGFLLPGFVDTHAHFPQLRVLGSIGLSLLEWLQARALPEEARMADDALARRIAARFVHAMLSHGTTSALVFGAHFPAATAALFEEADAAGIRMSAGQVFSDRLLRPDLHQSPQQGWHEATGLIRRFHRHGRLRYAVTPRFAVSTSEAMLEVCQTLLAEHEGLLLQTHINEHPDEIAEVGRLFPWAADYLAVYERFGLCRPTAVMAHNLHTSDSQLNRLAAAGVSVAHCPCSNAALGSGLFPLARHLTAGVRCALGTDVGAGTGFGLLKEGLQAYLLQRIAPGGIVLNPVHLLYLATLAGAEALGLADRTGDFSVGKAADVVYLRPGPNTPLAAVLQREEEPDRMLAAIFTLAGPESVREVRIEGSVVYRAAAEEDSTYTEGL